MTVAALPSSIEYVENGVTTTFALPFRFLSGGVAASRVLAGGAVVDLGPSDFTTAGGDTDAGGTATLVATVAGARIRFKRATPRAQSTDYTPNDRFPAQSHEAALDRAMLIDQEQDDKIAQTALRAFLVPDGEVAGVLPSLLANPNRFISTDALGRLVMSAGTGADAGLRTDLASLALGGSLIAYRAYATANAQTLTQVLDDDDFISAAAFGVQLQTPGTATNQSVKLNLAMQAAAALGKNLRVPGNLFSTGKYIHANAPVLVLPQVGIKGYGETNSVFRSIPGYTGGIFQLPVGPIGFGFFEDFGYSGNNEVGEHFFNFVAQPDASPAAHGGLWSWTFRRLRAENCGGITLKLWGGTDGKLPEQFITLQDCTFYRPNRATARCLSFAGQVGQVYAIGNNQFDGDIATGITPGTNIVVSKLYSNGATRGDIVDACNDDGSLKAGWSITAGANNYSYGVTFVGTTSQWSVRIVTVDQSYGFLFDGYVEGAKQAFTIQSGSTASICGRRLANAGALPASDGLGYLVCNDNSAVSVLAGTDVGGVFDKSFIRRGGVAGSYSISDGVRMPDIDVTTITSDFTVFPALTGGILQMNRHTSLLYGNGSGAPEDVNGLLGYHAPGTIVTITCGFNSILQFANSGSPAWSGATPPRLRFKDSLTVRINTTGTAWTIVGYAIAPLAGAAMPATAHYTAGEIFWNTSAFAIGTPIAWKRITTGTAHALGVDWQAIYPMVQQAAFANIGAAPTQANFNALLGTLRGAGVIAP